MTLIGYWPLNEDSGTTTYDYSGNENHGTVNNGGDSTVVGANGILGQKAYSFDGNNDYVDLGSPFAVSNSDSFTLVLWFRTSDVSKNQGLIEGANGGSQQIRLQINSGAVETVYWDGSSANKVSASISENNLHHVVFKYSSESNTVRLFLDGERIGSTSPGSLAQDPNSWWLGVKDLADGGKNYMQGTISEVRVYNRPLTQSEIQYLYEVSQKGSHTSSKKTL